MLTEKELYERLMKGETLDTIANELTSLLNSANSAYLADMKEKEKAKREEELDELAKDIIDAISAYVAYVNPKVGHSKEWNEAYNVEIMRETLDMGIAAIESLLAMTEKSICTNKKTDDEIIREFLGKIG